MPALSNKPVNQNKLKNPHGSKDYRSIPKFNPFLPCEPTLLVSDIMLPKHNLVLNKFCVIPGHVLLTTKEFQSQTEPLRLTDFEALCVIIKDLHPVNTLSFFNCGELSGASQPHKHVQLIPVSDNEPPLLEFLKAALQDKPLDNVFEIDQLPYIHRVSRISDPKNATVMYNLYMQMLSELGDEVSLHHNLVYFSNMLYLLPRSKEHYETNGETFSINSLGAVHMILAKSTEQVACLMKILGKYENNNVEHPDPTDLMWVGQWVGWPKKSLY